MYVWLSPPGYPCGTVTQATVAPVIALRTASGEAPVGVSIRNLGAPARLAPAPGTAVWGRPGLRGTATAATTTIAATAAAAASGVSHRIHRRGRTALGGWAAIASPRRRMLSGVTASASSRYASRSRSSSLLI